MSYFAAAVVKDADGWSAAKVSLNGAADGFRCGLGARRLFAAQDFARAPQNRQLRIRQGFKVNPVVSTGVVRVR